MRQRRRQAVSRLVRLERRLLVPGDLQARVVSAALTPEQRAAVEERDTALFVHANAGSGKTRVLVERFVRAVVEDGVPVDRILAITFTEKAAAELRARLRGAVPRARRARPRARGRGRVGLDHPRVLLEAPAPARAARRASTRNTRCSTRRARRGWRSTRSTARSRSSSTRTSRSGWTWPRPIRRTGCAAWSRRSTRSGAARGRSGPSCRRDEEPRLGDERERLAAALAHALAELGGAAGVVRASTGRSRSSSAAATRSPRCPRARSATPPPSPRWRSRRAAPRRFRATRCRRPARRSTAWVAACAARRAHGDYVLLRELLRGYTARYAEAKERESAVDFDDLELLACRLLEDNPALGERYREQFEHVLVDEFQDTNRLQIRLLRLLADEDGRLFTVGDEFQSIYGFRHADVTVFRELRDEAEQRGRVRALAQELPQQARDPRRAQRGLRARAGRRASSRSSPARTRRPAADQLQLDLNGSTPADGAPAVELIVVDQKTRALGRRRRGAVRRRPRRSRAMARGGDAPAGRPHPAADRRRAHARRHRRAAAGGGRHAAVRARAARARGRDVRGRRPQLLDAAAGRRPARVPGRACEPARRGGAVFRARLAARRALARRDRPARPGGKAAAAATRGGRSPRRTARTGVLDSFPSADRERVPELVARIDEHRALAATVPARAPARPGHHRLRATTARCSRCPTAAAGWRTCAS